MTCENVFIELIVLKAEAVSKLEVYNLGPDGALART